MESVKAKEDFSRKGAKAQSPPGSKQRSLRLSLRLCAFAEKSWSNE
jgi:hypothetical protein